MKALCATWVESLFGAETPRFEARFLPGSLRVSAIFTLSDDLQFKVRSIAGRSSGAVPVSSPGEALLLLTAEAGKMVERHLVRLCDDPNYRSRLPPVEQLATSCGIVSGCTACAGRGRLTCSVCVGTGRMTCPACGGRGSRSCGSCGGSGSKSVPVQTPYGFTYQYVSCGACGGGRVMCYCGGSGKATCSACQAGTITCNACGGSGVRTQVHSAEVAISVVTRFQVVDPPDDFVAQTAGGAPEAIASWTRLKSPGQRHSDRGRIGYEGECSFEDGVLTVAGRSARVVSIGAPGAAVAAAAPLDEACSAYRERVDEAAHGGLLSLLMLADANRLAATQVLQVVTAGKSRTVRIGIQRRGLQSQSKAERVLTKAVLSREFRDSCIAAMTKQVDLHVADFAARLHGQYKQALRLFLIGAAIGLPLLLAFFLPPLSAYRSERAMLLSYLGWIGVVATICGLVAAFRVVRLHRAERQLLSLRSVTEAAAC